MSSLISHNRLQDLTPLVATQKTCSFSVQGHVFVHCPTPLEAGVAPDVLLQVEVWL